MTDFISLENTLFVKDSLGGNIPTPLQDYFKLARNIHGHGTKSAGKSLIDIPQVRTQTYDITISNLGVLLLGIHCKMCLIKTSRKSHPQRQKNV